MKFWSWILIPFSWIFYGIVYIRNQLFNKGIFYSKFYEEALICIGNIRVGGTGKSPFTEYLIDLLKDHYTVSVLSRGYGRKTKGFLEVENPNSVLYGDEPSQFKSRFPFIPVYVCENRQFALDKILKKGEVVILDDAFQHRKIKAGMNWVLMEWDDLNKPVILLPAGNYREGLAGLKRTENILITKCLGDIDRDKVIWIRKKIRLRPDQNLFFSSIQYLPIKRIRQEKTKSLKPQDFEFILVFTGIGNPKPLENYLRNLKIQIRSIAFPDHHVFTDKDIQYIQNQFDLLPTQSKILLTTEKDAIRLGQNGFELFIQEYPVYFQPIQFQIQNGDTEKVKDIIFQYVQSTV